MTRFPDHPIEHPAEYRAFFRLFNGRRFYEAHEVLEDLWVIEAGELRGYYKGLIMSAVAILHWMRGNRRGALKLYRSGSAYLAPYPEQFEGFALGEFRREMARVFATLEVSPTTAEAPTPAQLPTIQLLG